MLRIKHQGRAGLALIAGAVLAVSVFAPATAWGQLYGRPVAQPYFDFPTWARFSDCRPMPLAWGYDPFPGYGAVDCASPSPVPIVACPGNFVAHRPSSWYASADFAPLKLDHQLDVEIARLGPDGPTVLDTGELQREFDAGGQFTFGRRIFDCYRIEGTYIGLHDYEEAAIATNNDPIGGGAVGNLSTLLSGFADPVIPGFDNVSRVSIALDSTFQSAEVNLRYWADMPPGPFDVSYLVGGRYIRIREQFNLATESALPVLDGGTLNDAQVNTENDLVGLQIGIQGACLISARWWFDFDLKGGIYNNSTNQATSFITTGEGEVLTGAEDETTAFVGDISLVANWQMTPNLQFRIGYHAIFIDGVAIASENLAANTDLLVTGPGRLDDQGEIAYHGPLIGLTWMR